MPPKRIPDCLLTVSVRQEPARPRSWVLCGLDSDQVREGTATLQSDQFRGTLAAVDRHAMVRLDESGSLVTSTTTHTINGPFAVGNHIVDLDRRHCSCASYKYRRTENGDRNCKHLNTVCGPTHATVYTKRKQGFQLISENVPRRATDYMGWVYSEKFDGIRVCIDGQSGWTRGGIRIDLSAIWTPPVGHKYDAELCVRGPEVTSHDRVMRYVLSGQIDNLHVRVFDLIETTQPFGRRLLTLFNLDLPSDHMVKYAMVNTWRGDSFERRIKQLQIDHPLCEGAVVRNPLALYDTSGRRSNQNAFKLKKPSINRLPPDCKWEPS